LNTPSITTPDSGDCEVARPSDDLDFLPRPADVEQAFETAIRKNRFMLGDCLAPMALLSYELREFEEPRLEFRLTNEPEPTALAIGVYRNNSFADLVVCDLLEPISDLLDGDHRAASDSISVRSICGVTDWLGERHLSDRQIRFYQNPLAWVHAGGDGVANVCAQSRQHFKQLANAESVECYAMADAEEVWEWTFGADPDALSKISVIDTEEGIVSHFARTARRRLRQNLRRLGEVSHVPHSLLDLLNAAH
jgi:hypothetical protein